LSADQRLVNVSTLRSQLPVLLAIGALGFGLLAMQAGTAIANPAALSQTSTSTRQAPDSLFPEVGSSRYDVKH
jgi:hypothetical protein